MHEFEVNSGLDGSQDLEILLNGHSLTYCGGSSLTERETYKCLRLGWNINNEYNLDGFFACLIVGKQRIGKSSLASQAVAEANGEYVYTSGVPECVKTDYESVKPYMVFRPKEFLDVVMKTTEKRKVIIWDDAGYSKCA